MNMKPTKETELCESVIELEKAGYRFGIDYGYENAVNYRNKLKSGTLMPPACKLSRNFMTPKECSEQFEFYAKSHPSRDSQHSLNFAANFLREFCIQ